MPRLNTKTQWTLSDGSTKLVAKNRALTGGTRAGDGAADLPLNYMQGLGAWRLEFWVARCAVRLWVDGCVCVVSSHGMGSVQKTGMPELREVLAAHMRDYHTPAYDVSKHVNYGADPRLHPKQTCCTLSLILH